MKKEMRNPCGFTLPQATPNRIKVLLVDDHPLVRQGVRACLLLYPQFEVIDEASSGQEAITKACASSPDIVVMDVSMSGMNGLTATSRLRECCPRTRVLILTVHEKKEFIRQAFLAGAAGYIRKNISPLELITAIERIHHGETGVMTRVAQKLYGEGLSSAPPLLPSKRADGSALA